MIGILLTEIIIVLVYLSLYAFDCQYDNKNDNLLLNYIYVASAFLENLFFVFLILISSLQNARINPNLSVIIN